MPTDVEVKTALIRCLKIHSKNGTLDSQTPRLLRAEVGAVLDCEVEDFKEQIKLWISEFLDAPPVENRKPKNKKKEKVRKPKRQRAASSSSEEYTSESSSDDQEAEASSVESLRSKAKMLGVPPSFWNNLEKDNFTAVAARLKEFCDSKSIERKGDIPDLREAKRYRAQRDATAELEGINSSNIVESKRRKCRDFIPLF